MKILFFIESLRCGGKERRLLELIRYLNEHTDYELLLVLTEDEIHYKYVYDLDVEIRILKRKFIRKDPGVFFKFFRLCNSFKPDIIHTWGSMLAFYALPVVILKHIPHVNGHIADAPVKQGGIGFHTLVTNLGFRYSDIILGNSYAGLESYRVSGANCRVIYNGIRLDRFDSLPRKDSVKSACNITTPFAVIMVASYTPNKKYDQFLDVAEAFAGRRDDLTFIGVGDTRENSQESARIMDRAKNMNNVLLLEKTDNVEALINACDIGVLFTYSEGISNSIIEYMACRKPVIANDAGGTREIITDKSTGFLVNEESAEEIALRIDDLLNNAEKRGSIGKNARSHIEKHFSVDRMGNDFILLYKEVLSGKKILRSETSMQ